MTMREARVSKGWSQDRLGVEAGDIAQNRISQIERWAGIPPKFKEAEGISKALGYPLGELFPEIDAEKHWPSSEEIKARIGEKESLPVPPLAKRPKNILKIFPMIRQKTPSPSSTGQ